jgi:hypothetical protein
MAKIRMTIVAMSVVFLIIIIIGSVHYQAAYSQMSNNMPRSQNLSSLLKNLLGPQKEVSGHYSNPQFGITDIIFPDGWHGSELPPIVGLTVITHPGSENQSSSSLSDIISPVALGQPQMVLQVLNNSDLANREENQQAFSISKACKPLAQNTTSVIDGRTFNVATIECSLSSLMAAQMKGMMSSTGSGENSSNQSNFTASAGGGRIGGLFKSLNLNPNAVMQSKLYELKTADKTYRVGVVVSNLFNSQSSERPDVSKYAQLLDITANTLKFR